MWYRSKGLSKDMPMCEKSYHIVQSSLHRHTHLKEGNRELKFLCFLKYRCAPMDSCCRAPYTLSESTGVRLKAS